MNRFEVYKRLGWSVLVVGTLAFAMSGCEGDDGRDGAAGAAGQQGPLGPQGPEGPEGPAGPGATVIPLESCGVCHDQGSFVDAAANHALPPIESVNNVAFAVNGADLEVTFDLTADGVAATGYDTVERGYRTEGTTRTTIVDTLTLTDNGGGNYTITIAGGQAQEAINNRYLFRVSAGGDSTTRIYLYGDFPASPVEDLAFSAAACTSCHGPEGIHVHGGYFAEEDGGEPCLACHGLDRPPQDPIPRLFEVAHEYHAGIRGDATFPTNLSNCSVCHSEPAELAAANAMPVSGSGCFSCHGSIAYWDFTGAAYNHAGVDETTNCQLCHVTPGGVPGALVSAAEMHNTIALDGRTLDNDGILWNGEDTSVTEGERFDWQITGIVDDGTNLAISWTASYDGVGVNPCNDTVAAGAPVFHAGGECCRIYRNYAQGEDFILGAGGNPGQPNRVNVDVNNTSCAANVATTTIPVEATTAGIGRLALNGKPLVVNVADPAGTMVARVPTPTYDWVIGTSDPAVARRSVVDTNKCLQCHVGTLYQHGGDRVDNVDTCLVCHNAAANEKYVRVGMGVDESEAYDGKVGEAFEMKTMLHRIHSANWDWDPRRGFEEYNPPYLVYRNRGIYAFAPVPPPNWDAGGTAGCSAEEIARGERDVFGSDPASSTSCQPHNFHAPTFPRSLNECTACHADDFTVIPDQTKAMASTTDAGSTAWEDQIDDVLQGAATTACITCHYNSATRGHAYQNSWEPQEFPEGRQTIIDAGN